MGDRTHVRLYIQAVHKAALNPIFEAGREPQEENEFAPFRHSHPQCVYDFDEVNYAELGFESELRELGIAYDKEWEAGGDYGAGTEYCRFTEDGELQLIEVYDEARNPDLDKLLAVIDDHAALKRLILTHKELITPLPWENQVEYGKRYRARQLIHA